jgi:hypothetical protein
MVRENDNGTLSFRCDECDAAPYARPGTGVHAAWMKRLKPGAPAPEPKPAPEKKPPADEKPAPVKKLSTLI